MVLVIDKSFGHRFILSRVVKSISSHTLDNCVRIKLNYKNMGGSTDILWLVILHLKWQDIDIRGEVDSDGMSKTICFGPQI